MVDRNLIRSLEDDTLSEELNSLFDGDSNPLDDRLETEADFTVNNVVEGTIIRVDDEFVVVDVGFKSEGTIHVNEWDSDEDAPEVGQKLQVLIEELEDEFGRTGDQYGMVSLSKRKAAKILAWTEMMQHIDEGQIVKGLVNRKIKGGLLVDIGVNVFLPASQVDIRRPNDIGDFIGQEVECEVLKIDEARRNIVVSRRSLIEKQRKEDRDKLLSTLEVDQIRKGVVKNIADFGAFVDLGGLDGLLHITDMSWERIGHPSEMVSIDQEIEVKILNIDRESEKVALGLKQQQKNPWDDVVGKYPVGDRVTGEVVNVMSYGAFVKLEPGIEGLVHISELSWTRRINHPNEILQIGDEVDVIVLAVNPEKQQMSMGIKQTQENPWDKVFDKYPADATVNGTVRNLTNYGAFIELEEGIDGLLHVSDMSWTRKIGHPSEVLEKGQEIVCKVISVDEERQRIALGLKQMEDDPWSNEIPRKYKPGQVITGTVTKITNFGVFVGLEDGLEGLLHISELADHKVENPEEVVSTGEQIQVKVLRVDTEDRKIGLSRKRVEWAEEDEAAAAAEEAVQAKAKMELKGGLGEKGPLILPESEEDGGEAAVEDSPANAEQTDGDSEGEAGEVKTEQTDGDSEGEAGEVKTEQTDGDSEGEAGEVETEQTDGDSEGEAGEVKTEPAAGDPEGEAEVEQAATEPEEETSAEAEDESGNDEEQKSDSEGGDDESEDAAETPDESDTEGGSDSDGQEAADDDD
jgi:small subunit ribosomal protein S1